MNDEHFRTYTYAEIVSLYNEGVVSRCVGALSVGGSVENVYVDVPFKEIIDGLEQGDTVEAKFHTGTLHFR